MNLTFIDVGLRAETRDSTSAIGACDQRLTGGLVAHLLLGATFTTAIKRSRTAPPFALVF